VFLLRIFLNTLLQVKQRTQSAVLTDSLPTVSSAQRFLSSLRAEKLKLAESHARLKHLKGGKEEVAVKSLASVPSGELKLVGSVIWCLDTH